MTWEGVLEKLLCSCALSWAKRDSGSRVKRTEHNSRFQLIREKTLVTVSRGPGGLSPWGVGRTASCRFWFHSRPLPLQSGTGPPTFPLQPCLGTMCRSSDVPSFASSSELVFFLRGTWSGVPLCLVSGSGFQRVLGGPLLNINLVGAVKGLEKEEPGLQYTHWHQRVPELPAGPEDPVSS